MSNSLKIILISFIATVMIFAEIYSIKNYEADKVYIEKIEKEYCTSTNIPKYKKIIWAISR